jgi:hypothetical protein
MRRYRAVRNTLKVIPTPWELASATVTSLWQLAEGSILWSREEAAVSRLLRVTRERLA